MKFDKRYTGNIAFIISTINSRGLKFRQNGDEFKKLLSDLCREYDISESYIKLIANWKENKKTK
jgi:hypothetical protein